MRRPVLSLISRTQGLPARPVARHLRNRTCCSFFARSGSFSARIRGRLWTGVLAGLAYAVDRGRRRRAVKQGFDARFLTEGVKPFEEPFAAGS